MPECYKNKESSNSLVIHLSEDVTVETIMVSNHEEFSANLGEIQFYGSSEYPPVNGKWLNLTSIFPEKGQE